MYQHQEISNVQNVSSQPGLYAFLGNGYTPAFLGKEKVKTMQVAIKKEKFANTFSKLGEGEMFFQLLKGMYVRYMVLSVTTT